MKYKHQQVMKKIMHILRWLFDDEFVFYKYHHDAVAYQVEFRNYRGQKQFWDSMNFTTAEVLRFKNKEKK